MERNIDANKNESNSRLLERPIDKIPLLIEKIGKLFTKDCLKKIKTDMWCLIRNKTLAINELKNEVGIKTSERVSDELTEYIFDCLNNILDTSNELNESGEFVDIEININKILLDFLENEIENKISDWEIRTQYIIEVLFLVDLDMPLAIKLFSKILNNENGKISCKATEILKQKLNEENTTNPILDKIYGYLNNGCVLGEVDVFYKFICRDEEIYQKLDTHTFVGIKLFLRALGDLNKEISKRANEILTKKSRDGSTYFYKRLTEYINLGYASSEDIHKIYKFYVKIDMDLGEINLDNFSGLKLVLTTNIDSRKGLREESERVLDEYIKTSKNRLKLIEYIKSDYLEKEEIYIILSIFTRNNICFDKNYFDELLRIAKKFPETNDYVSNFIESQSDTY